MGINVVASVFEIPNILIWILYQGYIHLPINQFNELLGYCL